MTGFVWLTSDVTSHINNEYSVSSDTASSLNRLGTKHYEFSDHLGNVLVTILDKRTGTGNAGGNYTGWLANVSAVNDYYPFGMLMQERSAEHNNYRFGHNTQEKTDEIAGKGNHHTAQFWEYSPRIARRWNVDPKPNVSISSYSAFQNNPILFSDVLGDTIKIANAIFESTMTALKVLHSTDLGKEILNYYNQSKTENLYIFAFDQQEGETNNSWAQAAKEGFHATYEGGKVKIRAKDAKGFEKFVNFSGFNFNTSAKKHLVGRNFTNDRHRNLDQYDLAFILYHEIKSHIKDGTGISDKDHRNFGNFYFVEGMGLWFFNKRSGAYETVVRYGSDSWNIFQQILQKKIDDGNGTNQNKEDLKYMKNYANEQSKKK